MAAAGRWSIEKFKQEFYVPPLQPAEGSHLMVAARRLPLYIGGMYRKLERCSLDLVKCILIASV